MGNDTTKATFRFPNTLAGHTLLCGLGFEPDDLYYRCMLDPKAGPSFGIEVRPPKARGIADWDGGACKLAFDKLNPGETPETAVERFSVDMAAWNKTPKEFRRKFLDESPVRKFAVEILLMLKSRGISPQTRGAWSLDSGPSGYA